MKGSTRAGDGKSKDNGATLISSVGELRRLAEANQLRLQHLELAIVDLTNICTALRNDIFSLGLSTQGSIRKSKAETTIAKAKALPSKSAKSEMLELGAQMQQLVEQAASLGILKQPKTTGEVKGTRNVEAATRNQKRSTRSLVQATEKKKMSMKIAEVKNMGATQTNAPRKNSTNNTKATATATAKVSLKSTVKKTKTKTTISQVYVESTAKRSEEMTKGSVSGKLVKLTVNANQEKNDSRSAVKSSALAMARSSGAPPRCDLNARQKWSNTKQITAK